MENNPWSEPVSQMWVLVVNERSLHITRIGVGVGCEGYIRLGSGSWFRVRKASANQEFFREHRLNYWHGFFGGVYMYTVSMLISHNLFFQDAHQRDQLLREWFVCYPGQGFYVVSRRSPSTFYTLIFICRVSSSPDFSKSGGSWTVQWRWQYARHFSDLERHLQLEPDISFLQAVVRSPVAKECLQEVNAFTSLFQGPGLISRGSKLRAFPLGRPYGDARTPWVPL